MNVFAGNLKNPCFFLQVLRKTALDSTYKTILLMLKKERQEFILREINLHNKVLTSDLCEAINVSEDTIRRDLSELAETGDIIKVHGGALSRSFHVSFKPMASILMIIKR
jgi:Fic family protein